MTLFIVAASSCLNMVELYDTLSMIVTQMIDVEMVNSGRAWMDNNKAQRQKFETLNDRLRLWQRCGSSDDQVMERHTKNG